VARGIDLKDDSLRLLDLNSETECEGTSRAHRGLANRACFAKEMIANCELSPSPQCARSCALMTLL